MGLAAGERAAVQQAVAAGGRRAQRQRKVRRVGVRAAPAAGRYVVRLPGREKMKSQKSLASLGLLLASVVPTDAQVMGIFADADGTRCNISAHPGAPGEGYLLFLGNLADGILGWDCRIEGLPSGWSGVTDSGRSELFGNGTGGSGVGLSPCWMGDRLLLAHFTITATSEQNDVVLRVASSTYVPLNCPVVVQCDYPAMTLRCVDTRPGFVNATTPPCIVGVEPRTWTQIKRLYD